MDVAMAQVVQTMSFFQLLNLRKTNRMMKHVADNEIIHRHNIKFGKNDDPIEKRIKDLMGWAQFHPGIFFLAALVLPTFDDYDQPIGIVNVVRDRNSTDSGYRAILSENILRPELYDELNIALNHYLYVIADAIANGETVDSVIKKMFKPGSQTVDLMLAVIKRIHERAMRQGIVPGATGQMGAWDSLDNTPYLEPMRIHGKSYPISDFLRNSEIDPKEVKRVLKPHYNFSDSQIVHIAVALSDLAAEIMSTGKDRGKFRTREHVKEAAMVLFGGS